MRKFFFLLLTFCSSFSFLFGEIQLTPQLEVLLNDIKLYKLDAQGDPYLHAGDLYEHSCWTYNAMRQLFANNSPYTQGLDLTEREQEVVELAALLHDIGKAGRKELFDRTHPKLYYTILKNQQGCVESIAYYQDRQEHPRISFAMAAKPLLATSDRGQDYFLTDAATGEHKPFGMQQFYDELELTTKEQQVIAILLGMHYEFGNVKHGKMTHHQFFDLLESLAQQVNYNNDMIDEKIVRLSVLIQVADVKGLVPVSACATPLFPEGVACCAVHEPIKFADPFKALGYEHEDSGCHCSTAAPVAFQAMEELLVAFQLRQQRTNQLPSEVFA